jgi:hypothetical protein
MGFENLMGFHGIVQMIYDFPSGFFTMAMEQISHL